MLAQLLLMFIYLCLRNCCSCYNVSTAAAHVHQAKSFFFCPAVELIAGTAAGPAVAIAEAVTLLAQLLLMFI